MAISKKGTRSIQIDAIHYLYKISKGNPKAPWRESEDELDENFMRYARYYGLGSVKDITINVVVQVAESPLSNLYVKIQTQLIDGFMGSEQSLQLQPKHIAEFIEKGLEAGWKPNRKGDVHLIFNALSKGNQTTLHLLPNQ